MSEKSKSEATARVKFDTAKVRAEIAPAIKCDSTCWTPRMGELLDETCDEIARTDRSIREAEAFSRTIDR